MTDRVLSDWELCYRGWDPDKQALREALTTVGNGYFATRGAAEEAHAGGPHYPGTYLAGGYDRMESKVAGRAIENEDLVNWPNWLPLTFRCEGGEWFDLDQVEVLDYEQTLQVRHGVLLRRVRFRDGADREFLLESRRLVHMEYAHVAAIEWVLTPLNWSGEIVIQSAIDGRVTNQGVERYRELNGKHLDIVETATTGEETIYLVARTKQSQIVMAQAARTQVMTKGDATVLERRSEVSEDWIGQCIKVKCEAGKAITVEKVISLYTSRDAAISEPCHEACKHIHRVPNFATLLERQKLAWKKLWSRADLHLKAHNHYAQLVLRLHIFHMLQTASMNTIDLDVGIPARGLHGEAYRGHIFWDEIFMFPFINLRIPELTRSLLMYRYRRMDEARYAAKQEGYKGAMFPWQSGSDGREESQVIHLNPKSGRWIPDNTHRQRHVNAAIAYNVWQYFQATSDMEFLSFYGAEMLLEIARFCASIAEYNPKRERYEIKGVVGPDEYHTKYPDTDDLGINNNAYTNVMASWVLCTAQKALSLLAEDRRQELLLTLELSEQELECWDHISRRMFVPFHDDGIISQFEGWEKLEELDWEGLKQRHGDIQRLDRVLEAEGSDPNRFKASKQADVLMLFFLFSSEELYHIFERLSYEVDQELIPRNIKYYIERTSHGSTLSQVVHAWVLARADRKRSWHLFKQALASDIEDIQGGTTPEGIHMGAMAGVVDLMQRCYTGLEMRDEILWLNPQLPDAVERLKLSIRFRGHWLALDINHQDMVISLEKGWSAPAFVGFKGEVHEIAQGDQVKLDLATREVIVTGQQNGKDPQMSQIGTDK